MNEALPLSSMKCFSEATPFFIKQNTPETGAARKGIVRNTKSMRERGVLTDRKPKKRTVQTCLKEY